MAQDRGRELLELMVEAIGAELRRGESAKIPGLGTFAARRQPSRHEILENGDILVTPPRNTVVFLSNKAEASP